MKKPEDPVFMMKEKMFNKTVFYAFFLALMVLIPSLFRATYSGFQPTHIIIVVSVVLLLFIMLMQNKLNYYIRLSIYVSIFSSIGCSGLFHFGLIGEGSTMLLFAPLLLAVFASLRSSLILLGVHTVYIIFVMFLYTTGRRVWNFDPLEYHSNIVSWLTMLVGIIVYTGIAVSIISNLLNQLRSLINELSQRVVEIRNLNENLELKVESRTAELLQANQEKDQILGVVAHDIRNKLSGLSGYLELLLDQSLSLNDEKKHKYLQKAFEGVTSSQDIVNDLLDFARIQGEERIFETECIDVVPFIKSSVEDHLPLATEKGVELITENKQHHFFCNINRTKFSRVIDNLVTNAIKFTHSGGTITIDIKRESEGIVIRICDTGIGIPDSLKSHLFNPFTPSGRSGTGNENSTGLGLSICEKIMEKHHGKIWVESEEGKGCTFFLLLPSVSSSC